MKKIYRIKYLNGGVQEMHVLANTMDEALRKFTDARPLRPPVAINLVAENIIE